MLLNDYLQKLSLSLTDYQQNQVLQHIELLAQWNKRINITAIPKNEMLEKHIVDSLSIANFFSSYSDVADVGTGGGFPGLPLAIVYPQNRYILMDSNHKKCGFLTYVVNALKLKNVSVIHSRIEQFKTDNGLDAVVCRALSTPQKVYNLCSHMVKHEGKIFVMASKSYQQVWIDDASLLQKEAWLVHPLASFPNMEERYLLEHTKA